MGIIDRQIEKWMTKSTFDNLDKSTIPEGTEINVVGDIEESDLSLDLINKINKPSGHCYKVSKDTGVGWYGKLEFYINTNATNISELAIDIIERQIITGTTYLADNSVWGNHKDTPYFGTVVGYVQSCAVNGTSNAFNLAVDIVVEWTPSGSNLSPQNKETVSSIAEYLGDDNIFTVEQLY